MRSLSDAERRQVIADYDRDGYAYVRGMFDAHDLAPLAASLDDGSAPGAFAVTDSQGGKQELSVWLDLADDLIGVIPRLQPIVDLAETAVDDRVYHWHSKLSWKRPHARSLWDWHQDYAFWAENGVARPHMCTIAVAIGPVTEANGCMRLVRGSHRLGALPITPVGEGQGTDPDAVATALADHDTERCELASGDVVVFHSNTLHSSGPNESDVPRTMLMMSYNAVSNAPTAPLHPGYALSELDVLPLEALASGWTDVFGATAFVDPAAEGLDQGYATE